MSDLEIAALKAARDLGLTEPDLDGVTATVSAALEREYRAEGGPGDLPRKARKPGRRKRFAVAVLVALAVGGVATVGYAALSGSSTDSDGIGCYPGDEIGGSVTVAGLDGRRATKTCADLWAAGAVVPGVHKVPASLHACVSGDGGGPIRVLANSDASICAQVGLVEDPDAGTDPEARRFGGFSSQLSDTLEREEREGLVCAGRQHVRQLVKRLLTEHELKDWTIVESGDFNQINRCATLALDSDARVVTLFAERP